jgi:DNA-binding transcriptional regulator YhcF (GntR family)
MRTASRSRIAPLSIQLDARLRMPAYLQISQQIRSLTVTGRVKPGAQLPTVRAVARRLGLNFNTVARAYRLLVDQGLLSTQPGRGTFVLSDGTRPRPRRASIHALARDFIAHSRLLEFSDEQLTRAFQRELRHASSGAASGDKHG